MDTDRVIQGDQTMKQHILANPLAEGLSFFAPVDMLRREVDRLFERFDGGKYPIGTWNGNGRILPDIDLAETDKDIVITAELPGVDPKEVDVSLQGDMIIIRGEKKSQRDEKKESYQFAERTYGVFERVMTVPKGIDSSKIKAEFDKGVLKVTMPKPAELQTPRQKIEIKAST